MGPDYKSLKTPARILEQTSPRFSNVSEKVEAVIPTRVSSETEKRTDARSSRGTSGSVPHQSKDSYLLISDPKQHRQGPAITPHGRIHKREDGCVCKNAERQGQQHSSGEPGALRDCRTA